MGVKRYEFAATISLDAHSLEEARAILTREVVEAKAPLWRRLRGDVRAIKVATAPEPLSVPGGSRSLAQVVQATVEDALKDAALDRWRFINCTDFADLGKQPTPEELRECEDQIRREIEKAF